MTRRAAWLLAPLAIVSGILLVAYLTLLLFPSSEVVAISSRAAARQGFLLRVGTITKTLPLGLRATNVTVSRPGATLLALDAIEIRPRFVPLLAGRLVIAYSGNTAGGTFSGEFETARGGRVEVSCSGIRLEGLPFLQTLSARIAGRGTGSGNLLGNGGRVRFSIDGFGVSGARIGGVVLPDVASQTVESVISYKDGVIRADSVTMQGEGLYARLRGEVRGGGIAGDPPIALSLELMPKPDFLDRQRFVFLALARYSDSPGHYLLPIGGTVGRPELR